jgi:alpha-1,3-rhamnosyl/mannosyltransferase
VKVAVNLLWCLPGQVGGSEEYVTRALGALLAEPAPPEVVLYALPSFAAAHPELTGGAASVVAAPTSGRRRAIRVAVERSWLRRRVGADDVDVVHHAGGTAPFGRRGGRPRTVVSIHDIQYVSHPEHFSAVKRRWLAHQVPAAVRRADVLTVPTDWVGDTLVEHVGAERGRIHVLPHPPPRAVAPDPTAIAAARRRYELPGPYLIFPAATYPHKNHGVLLSAMTTLRRTHPELRLVLTGGQGRGEAAVEAAIADRGLAPVVRRTGRVSAAERDALVSGASALVFPSRYEGFGAPVVEAMVAGVPVVASTAAALPEVVGDAGRLVDPDDVAGWVRAIDELLGDAAARAALVAAGHRRSVTFTPERTAAALRGAYEAALAGQD